jgi:adenylate cyclase
MRRLFSRFGLRQALGVAIMLVAAAQIVGVFPSTLVDRIDLFAYEMRMKLQPVRSDDRIVIVDIDEKSLAEVGRWPWSRDVIASLVDRMAQRYRARAIAFDVLFTEADTSSGYRTLEALAGGQLKEVPGFGERVRALKPILDYDARLAKALQGRPVVLSFYLANLPPNGLLPSPAFTAGELGDRTLDALTYHGYNGSLPILQRAARAGGYMNTEVDADGQLRSVPLLARVGDAYYESLALATARVALDAQRVSPVFPEDALRSEQAQRDYGMLDALLLDSLPRHTRIPVEPGIKALINFRGPGGPAGGSFRYVSAADVLKGRIAPAELEDRILLVGTTAAGLNDLRAAPVNREYPGVEAHANLIASILDGDFKRRPDYAAAIDLLQVLLIGTLLIVALARLSPAASMLFALAVAALAAGFNFWMYQSFHMVLPLATVLLLILGLFTFNLGWGYLFEYRRGRAMVNLFAEYVAPELVAEMAADPERYSMEGESRVLSVLFADVRGFTTISEGLDPNALREYINLYLTAVSEDIRGNRGTLDKYIGDAVMAFWGAPVALPDHAARAVATALAMQATARRLNAEFIARGWPPLQIGVGINTGEMRVGDMGSKIRRAYTVMGDAVNLASRLEGITKAYGVGIVVGEGTMRSAPAFAWRELDRVQVKGKNEPVPIFEPVGLSDALDDAARRALDDWHAALALVRRQQWDAAEAALLVLRETFPHDRLYRLYLERIAHYRQRSPGEDWDGVTAFDAK